MFGWPHNFGHVLYYAEYFLNICQSINWCCERWREVNFTPMYFLKLSRNQQRQTHCHLATKITISTKCLTLTSLSTLSKLQLRLGLMVLKRDNCVSNWLLKFAIMHIKTQFHHTSFTRYVHHIIQTQHHTVYYDEWWCLHNTPWTEQTILCFYL